MKCKIISAFLGFIVLCSCTKEPVDYRDTWVGKYKCTILDDEGARLENIEVNAFEFTVFVDKALDSVLLISGEKTKGPEVHFPLPHINTMVDENGRGFDKPPYYADLNYFYFANDSIYVKMYLGSAHGAGIIYYLTYLGKHI